MPNRLHAGDSFYPIGWAGVDPYLTQANTDLGQEEKTIPRVPSQSRSDARNLCGRKGRCRSNTGGVDLCRGVGFGR